MTDEITDVGVQMDLCQVRKMGLEDAVGAAALHRQVFPDYFLTHMGQGFLERFYSEFVDQNGNYGFVAIHGEELVGSVIGTLDYGRFFSRFYRRRFLSTVMTLVGRFLADPYVRRNLISRMAHIRQALHSITVRRRLTDPTMELTAADPRLAHLLSIGVRPDWRGFGIAERLVDRYCNALWQGGWQRVGLSVLPENQRAIAFYEKTGWQQVGESAAAVQYVRSTRPMTGGPP